MYIVFLNPQGNFDHLDSYWTMHPDFGGQLVYVKEIAIALSKMGHKVDIITRKFNDSMFPEFKDQFDYYTDIANVRIVRIKSGPTSFLNKEDLWPYLDEWVNNINHFFESANEYPDFITGHYGDGGYASQLLKNLIHKPYSLTGHSLGAQKLEKLGATVNTFPEINEKYHFSERLLAERITIQNADLIFVSTDQERDEQYTHPLYLDASKYPFNRNAFYVCPPGANTSTFTDIISVSDEAYFKVFEKVLSRDISNERLNLPLLVLASRLDPKKNHLGVIKAFANDLLLQDKVNIAISLRGIEDAFKDYSHAKKDELVILDEMMKIIDDYKLAGKVSFISINSQNELASFYRYSANKKSIFVLTSLYEPFGLAPIEAMSAGLPAVVTENGGPKDVLFENGIEYGVLVDPFNPKDIASGVHKMLVNYDEFKKLGKKRVNDKYTWASTAKNYLDAMNKVTYQENQDLSFDQEAKTSMNERINEYLLNRGV